MIFTKTNARLSAFGITCLMWSSLANADWDVSGAAARCVAGESLIVVAVDWTSEDSPGSDPVPPGYARLDGKTTLSCKVGNADVAAVIHVYPPAGQGMGMGSGYVSIDSLKVDGLPILGHPTAFNWQIPGSDRALVKVTVFTKESVPCVEICDAESCHQQSLGADRLLNQTYQQALAALPEPDRQRLRQEQRFWLKERDPQCRLKVVRLQNEPLGFLRCVLSATEVRTIRLREWQKH